MTVLVSGMKQDIGRELFGGTLGTLGGCRHATPLGKVMASMKRRH